MKKELLFFLLLSISLTAFANSDQTNSSGTKNIVIRKIIKNQVNHYYDVADVPDVFYNSVNSNITVDFGDQPVGNYCVTISSPFADVDYYTTSPFTTIPIAVDGINDYNIIIETDDGDIFEGTLLATDCHPTERL